MTFWTANSYLLDPDSKFARYSQLLHELPTGLNEMAVHPGFDNMELLALEPAGKHERQIDYDFWMSRQVKDIIMEEGIILLDYRALQAVWRGK
ncbi:MAG: hypothetical protein ABSA01_11700 [Anaerolineales bacterium]|jgi:hypothetical protein